MAKIKGGRSGDKLSRKRAPTKDDLKPKKGISKKTTLPSYTAVKVSTYRSEYDLVPVGKHPDHPVYPKVDTDLCPGQNYYAVEPKLRKPTQIVTVLDDGLCLGWAYCGRCKSWWGKCVCRNGVSCPRSVEYIHDKRAAEDAGEEWTYLHPNYRGSITRKAREERSYALEDKGKGGKVIAPPTAPHKPSKRLSKGKAAPTTGKGLQRRTKPAQDAEKVMSSRGVDSAALDDAAKQQAKDLNNEVLANAQGASTTGKRLKRRRKHG